MLKTLICKWKTWKTCF